MSIKGSLATCYLASLLQLLCNDRKTGTLRLWDGDHRVTIAIKDGAIVNATSSVLQEQLGYLLRSERILTAEELDIYLDLARHEKKRLGTVLIEQGKIAPETLKHYLHLHIEHILYTIFLWKTGTFEYDDAPLEQEDTCSIELDTIEVILEASRRVDELSVLTQHMPDPATVVTLAESPPSSTGILTPQEQAILSLVDGRRTLQQIVRESGYDTFTVYKIVYALTSSGFIKPREDTLQLSEPAEQRMHESLQPEVHADHDPAQKQSAPLPAEHTLAEPSGTKKPLIALRPSAVLAILGIMIIAAVGGYILTRQKASPPDVTPFVTTPAEQPAAPAKTMPEQTLPQHAPETASRPYHSQSIPEEEVSEQTEPFQDRHNYFFVDLPSGYSIQDRSAGKTTHIMINYPPNIFVTVRAEPHAQPWDSDNEMYAMISSLHKTHPELSQISIMSHGPYHLSSASGFTVTATAMQQATFCKLVIYGMYGYKKKITIEILCKHFRTPRVEAQAQNIHDAIRKTFLVYP
ncbi:MAG: DUF4388 domain-containing protein [Desulfobacterota bacterium]|nr:DUF4388 domain-containing protein [Thermodesulfobacteriota bacterium]